MKQEKSQRERIPVMFGNEKVGEATADSSGTVTMSINSPFLANRFGRGITEHITIVPKNKE